MARILIAEDDPSIRAGLIDTLESEGYRVSAASDGAEALALYSQDDYDLALLDIMMPKRDGYAVCQEIRRQNPDVAILILTAKGQEIDKVLGLKLGADDYITKPFGIQELLARVEAGLRRSRRSHTSDQSADLPDCLEFDGFQVARKAYEIKNGVGVVAISAREMKLLETFYQHPGEALSRDTLLNVAWGIDYYGTTRTLDQHVAQLRKKLTSIGVESFLKTIHGVGYRYR